jgi:hypothetical protein
MVFTGKSRGEGRRGKAGEGEQVKVRDFEGGLDKVGTDGV